MSRQSKQICVIDLGMGNIKSVQNMFQKIGCDVRVEDSAKNYQPADLYVLPGIGAFDTGMRRLAETGWDEEVVSFSIRKIPILGICLGMQLLCDSSTEGNLSGLKIIPGHFDILNKANDRKIKVPHMGWNQVKFIGEKLPWSPEPTEESRYYFVHSFQYVHDTDEHVIATCDYGGIVVAGVKTGSAVGLQFHPEKSHIFGLNLLENYVRSMNA